MRTKMNITRKLAALCVAVTTVASVVAFAAPANATESQPDSIGTESTLTTEQESELTALVDASDFNTTTFDASVAASAGVDAQAIMDYGTVVAAAGWIVQGQLPADTDASQGAKVAVKALSGCTGRSGYTGYYTAFWQIALNSCQTSSLILAIRGVGGGTAAIGGLLSAIGFPGGAIVAAVGVLIVANPWPLDVCKAASGKNAIYINIFVVGGTACWGQ